jgi:putative ABC transport system permease protein
MNLPLATLLTRGTLAANGFRILLTLACIALGVALAGAVHTVHSSALAEIERAARAISGTADVEIRGPRSGPDDALFITIAARPEVSAASPIVEIEAALADGEGTLRLLGIDPFRAIRLTNPPLWRMPSPGVGEAACSSMRGRSGSPRRRWDD